MRSSSKEGLVNRYTTDCPEQENARLTVQLRAHVGDAKQAADAIDQHIALIDKALSKNGKIAYTLVSKDFNISQRGRNVYDDMGESKFAPPFSVSGNISMRLNSVQEAKQAFVLLSEAGLIAGLAIHSSIPEHCERK